MTVDEEIEKFKRIRKATFKDEDPLVQSLKKVGYTEVHRNTDRILQRVHGDVFFRRHGEQGVISSIESQVTDTNFNFSYSREKVLDYVGPSGLNYSYVFLGCKSREPGQMIYAMVRAKEFHLWLLSEKSGADDKGKYFLISPGTLAQVPGTFAMASTIDKVVQEFSEVVRDEK